MVDSGRRELNALRKNDLLFNVAETISVDLLQEIVHNNLDVPNSPMSPT